MKKATIMCLMIFLVSQFLGCKKASIKRTPRQQTVVASKIKIGGFYVSRNSNAYEVIRVLSVDGPIMIRTYKNTFASIPKDLDLSTLIPGFVDESDGPECHFPLTKKEFWKKKPVLIAQEPVTDDDWDYVYQDIVRPNEANN